jgi:hypothetical protein
MKDVPSVARLGPFKVSAVREEIEAFCRETGWSLEAGETRVPHTFPMRWLSSSDLRAAIEATLQMSGGIAVHEAQSFAYERKLEADCDYVLNAELESQKNPDRLILRASIMSTANEPMLQVETILRIVGASDAQP